jgi:hypothetical protein
MDTTIDRHILECAYQTIERSLATMFEPLELAIQDCVDIAPDHWSNEHLEHAAYILEQIEELRDALSSLDKS